MEFLRNETRRLFSRRFFCGERNSGKRMIQTHRNIVAKLHAKCRGKRKVQRRKPKPKRQAMVSSTGQRGSFSWTRGNPKIQRLWHHRLSEEMKVRGGEGGAAPLKLRNGTPLPLWGQKFGNKNEEFYTHPRKFLQPVCSKLDSVCSNRNFLWPPSWNPDRANLWYVVLELCM